MKRRLTRIHFAALIISGPFASFDLVYASGKETLETRICTRAKELDKASEHLKELNEGEEP